MATPPSGFRAALRSAVGAAAVEVARAWAPSSNLWTPTKAQAAPRPEEYAPTPALAGYPTSPEYQPADAMSAFSAFPWVYACVSAIAEDLAGLPLYAVRGTGTKARRVRYHPALDLFDNPEPGITGALAREQRVIDLRLTGSSWELVQTDGVSPVALSRLHPDYVYPIADAAGRPIGLEYRPSGGPSERWGWDAVSQIRLPSWEADNRKLFGTGAIRPLHRDLTATAATAERTATTARQGRPSAILSPVPASSTGEAQTWTPKQIRELEKAAATMATAKDGGIAILNSGIKLDILGWSPRDLEYVGQLAASREAVLAVFGVPPTRLQLPTANYAASRDGMIQYWMNLKAAAARIEAAYTAIARRYPDSWNISIRHDFSGVAYLQDDRAARLDRVVKHVSLGMPAAAAYAYEGFDDAPIPPLPPEPEPEPEPDPPPADEPPAEPPPADEQPPDADPLAEALDAIAADPDPEPA